MHGCARMTIHGLVTVKINCTQCGAEHVVIESDFFLRCPFCEARIIVDPPANVPALVESAVTEEYVRRLFPSDMVSSVELKFFPYYEKEIPSGREIHPCFSQPWKELEEYIPPSGNRKVFDESLTSPDQLIPFDRDMAEESENRIIFHPFFVVMLKLEGYEEGLLVDALSGKLIGESPLLHDDDNTESALHRIFFMALLIGLLFTVPIYLLTRNLDSTWISRIWVFIAITPFTVVFFFSRIKGGRS